MGRTCFYTLSARELEARIHRYFQHLQEDPTVRGGPSDFLSYVELDMPKAREIVQNPPKPYLEHRRLLLQAAVLLRAHLETSPAWANSNSSKSVFLAKQQLWDGLAYTDKPETAANTSNTIHIKFGTGESRKEEEEQAFE